MIFCGMVFFYSIDPQVLGLNNSCPAWFQSLACPLHLVRPLRCSWSISGSWNSCWIKNVLPSCILNFDSNFLHFQDTSFNKAGGVWGTLGSALNRGLRPVFVPTHLHSSASFSIAIPGTDDILLKCTVMLQRQTVVMQQWLSCI